MMLNSQHFKLWIAAHKGDLHFGAHPCSILQMPFLFLLGRKTRTSLELPTIVSIDTMVINHKLDLHEIIRIEK